MQAISILILGLIELLFLLVTIEQKENKGGMVVGMLITIILLIPIMYIINN